MQTPPEASKLPYYPLETMLAMIAEPNRTRCFELLTKNRQMFEHSPGSSYNHQTWPGGYLHHVTEVMNNAIQFYALRLAKGRVLPFSLESALLVLFLHDLEKPWKYVLGISFGTKAVRRDFRDIKIAEYGITLTDDEENALRYVEGEGDDYHPTKRAMNELAAFCHICNLESARIDHKHPLEKGDPWSGDRTP